MAEKLISGKGQVKRIPIGIKELDENMEGGIPVNSSVLIAGAAGTMKSSIAFNAIYQEAQKGNNVLYISLEQSYISLLNHMIHMGFDFQKIDVTVIGSDPTIIKKKIEEVKKSKRGHIIVSDLGSLRATLKNKSETTENWWNIIAKITKHLKDDAGITTAVLDSLNSLYVLCGFKEPRSSIFQIFQFYKDLDITSFFVSEMPKDGSKYGQYEIEDFLSDGVIVINLVERNRKVTREISIPKMRATNANIDIFSLEYDEKKGFRALYGGKIPIL